MEKVSCFGAEEMVRGIGFLEGNLSRGCLLRPIRARKPRARAVRFLTTLGLCLRSLGGICSGRISCINREKKRVVVLESSLENHPLHDE